VLPGSRIPLGQRVLVDYSYQIEPRVSSQAVLFGYDVNLRMGPLRLYARGRRQESLDAPLPVDAGLPVLWDIDRSGVGFQFRLPLGPLTATAQGEDRTDRTHVGTVHMQVANAELGLRLGRRLNVNSSIGFVDQAREGNGAYHTVRQQHTVQGRITREWTVSGSVYRWLWDDLLDGEELFTGAGVRSKWSGLGQVLSLAYEWGRWEMRERDDHRVTLQVTRSF